MDLLGPAEFAKCLAELRPRIGRYDWIWWLLRRSSKPAPAPWNERFPTLLYERLRRFFRPNRPYFIGRTSDGTAFLGDCRDLYAIVSVVLGDHDVAIVDFIKSRLDEARGCYLDVGTNMGVVAASIARSCNHTQVIAFEPHPDTARRAAATFALNMLQNVRLLQVAIGDTDGCEELSYPIGHSAGSTMHPVNHPGLEWETTTVASRTLDSLCEKNEFKNIGLIKLDVEGHELAALRGAARLLASNSPDLIYEYNPDLAAKAGWTLSTVDAELAQLGLEPAEVLSQDGTTSPYPPRVEPKETINVWCTSRMESVRL